MTGLQVARSVLALLATALGVVLVAPLLLLLAPLWLIGAAVRGLARLFTRKTLSWQELIEYAPVLGWRPRPRLDARALDYNQDTYHVTTGPDGWRGRTSLEEAEVVVFGDSHAFGCGVDDEAFFAERAWPLRIKAIGCPGYSLVQPVMLIERLAPRLRGRMVVLFVCIGNDLDDSLHPALLEYRGPFVRGADGTGDWRIEAAHVSPARWTINSREGSMDTLVEICTPGSRSRRVFDACAYLIERAQHACREVEARLVVMAIPELSPVARQLLDRALAASGNGTRFDETLPDRELGRICERVGAEFVSLREHLTPADYLERDFHWNERGHQRVAALLGELYASDRRTSDSGPDDRAPLRAVERETPAARP